MLQYIVVLVNQGSRRFWQGGFSVFGKSQIVREQDIAGTKGDSTRSPFSRIFFLTIPYSYCPP